MSKDKFIEFCVDYLPYKECVERYGQYPDTITGLDVVFIFFGVIGISIILCGSFWFGTKLGEFLFP